MTVIVYLIFVVLGPAINVFFPKVFGDISLIWLVFYLLMIASVLEPVINKATKQSARLNVWLLLMAFFYAIVFASISWSEHYFYNIETIKRVFARCFVPLVVAFIGLNTLSSHRNIKKLVWSTLLVALFLSLTSIFQLVFGFHMLFKPEAPAGAMRASATFANPNALAIFLVLCVPYILYGWDNGFIRSWLATGVLFITAGGIVSTVSRKGLVTGFIMCLLYFYWKKQKKRLVATIVLCFVGAMIFSSVELISHRFDLKRLEGQFEGKMNMALAGLDMFISHPLIGLGYQGYYENFGKYFPTSIYSKYDAHNMYITVLANYGLLGFLPFFFFLLYPLTKAWIVIHGRNHYYSRDLAIVCASSIVIFMINGYFAGGILDFWPLAIMFYTNIAVFFASRQPLRSTAPFSTDEKAKVEEGSQVRLTKTVLFLAFFLSLMLPTAARSENLLPNSSFEMTTTGDLPDCWNQYLGPVKHPDWYSLWTLDTVEAYDGANSVRLSLDDDTQTGTIYLRPSWSPKTARIGNWQKYQLGQKYTLSLYLKADRDDYKVGIHFPKRTVIRVDRQWKRYVLTGMMVSDFLKTFKIVPLAAGKLWIDAVQLQKGNLPSSYCSSKNDEHLFPELIEQTQDAVSRELFETKSMYDRFRISSDLSYYTSEDQAMIEVKVPDKRRLERARMLMVKLIEQDEAVEGEIVFSSVINRPQGIYSFSLPLSKVKKGHSKLCAYLTDCNMQTLDKCMRELIRLEPKANEVKINGKRRTIVVDDQEFFFFGTVLSRTHHYHDRLDGVLSRIHQQGYTVVVPTFAGKQTETVASKAQVRLFFDAAKRHGLKVVPWVEVRGARDMRGKVVNIRKVYDPASVALQYMKEISFLFDAVGDHPALLAWIVCDEPFRSDFIKFGLTKKLVDYMKSLDPYHPAFVNYNQALTDELKFTRGTVPGDIVSMTQYPVPLRPLSAIAEMTGLEMIAGEERKPVFLWLQFWSGHGRCPTPQELSCMTYLSTIYGANGYYTWPTMPGSKSLWEAIKEVIAEMKSLQPIIANSPSDHDLFHVADKRVHYGVRLARKRLYVIAANPSDACVKTDFRIDPRSGYRIRAVTSFGDNRPVASSADRFSVAMESYGHNVYVIDLH